MTLILGLETSCDETAASVVEDGHRVLSNVVASQHELHERYAGVVPEIASRAHIERLMPVITDALQEAGCKLTDIDAIAVGNRPGLVGSLIVGVSAAKTLAWSLNKPLIGVDHVRAHLHAAFLSDLSGSQSKILNQKSKIALGLVVSGGHTSLYLLTPDADPQPLGRTIDDAIGEAYDKAAVMLDAGYPGGQSLDRLAQTGDANAPGVPKLPVSMLAPGSLDFSFSGLKTALLYAVRGHPVGKGKSATFERSVADLSDIDRANLAAAFQHAAVEAIIRKLKRALKQLSSPSKTNLKPRAEKRSAEAPDALTHIPPTAIVLGGGVSANSLLRKRVQQLGDKMGLDVHLPQMDYCVDNAAMIAGFAHTDLLSNRTDSLDLPVIATTKHG